MQEKCKKSLPLSGFGLSQPLSFRAIGSWEFFQEKREVILCSCFSLCQMTNDEVRLINMSVYFVAVEG